MCKINLINGNFQYQIWKYWYLTESKYQWLSLQAGHPSLRLVCHVFRGFVLLVYWSCLFEAFCNSNNLASRFLHFSLKLQILPSECFDNWIFYPWYTFSNYIVYWLCKVLLNIFQLIINIIEFTINTIFDLFYWRLKASL